MGPIGGVEGIGFWPAWPPDASDFGDPRERRLARQLAGGRRSAGRGRLVAVLAIGIAIIAWYDAGMAITTAALLLAMTVGVIMGTGARHHDQRDRVAGAPRRLPRRRRSSRRRA